MGKVSEGGMAFVCLGNGSASLSVRGGKRGMEISPFAIRNVIESVPFWSKMARMS